MLFLRSILVCPSEIGAKPFIQVFQDALAPVPTVISYEDPGSKTPAIVIGATPLEGGLILCLCAHHVVMDGTGMGTFLKFLGDCIRDLNRADTEVPFDSRELRGRESWLRYVQRRVPKALLCTTQSHGFRSYTYLSSERYANPSAYCQECYSTTECFARTAPSSKFRI